MALAGGVLLAALPGSTPLRAGSAQPGGIRPAILGDAEAPVFRRLVGRWKLMAMESGGKPVPMPASVQYLFILDARGTVRVEMGQPNPKIQELGRWQVKGRRFLMQTKSTGKTETLEFQITGDRLTLVIPGGAQQTRLVFERVRASRRQ